MKKIVVPCDFSEASREAYKFAIEIASASGGEIIVFHSINIPVMYESTFGFQPYLLDGNQLERLANSAQQAFVHLQKLHRAPANLSIRFASVFDPFLPALKKFCNDNSVDLIVMGTRGSSGIEEYLIGSNTEKVIRFATVPVIALETAPFLSDIKEIVLPTALGLDQMAFMSKVCSLQKFFDATLHLLWVNTPTNFKNEHDAFAALHDFAKHYKLQKFTINYRSSLSERSGIIAFALEKKAHLLAMGTHGRQGIAHFLMGSVTEEVANHLPCPLWTARIHH